MSRERDSHSVRRFTSLQSPEFLVWLEHLSGVVEDENLKFKIQQNLLIFFVGGHPGEAENKLSLLQKYGWITCQELRNWDEALVRDHQARGVARSQSDETELQETKSPLDEWPVSRRTVLDASFVDPDRHFSAFRLRRPVTAAVGSPWFLCREEPRSGMTSVPLQFCQHSGAIVLLVYRPQDPYIEPLGCGNYRFLDPFPQSARTATLGLAIISNGSGGE